MGDGPEITDAAAFPIAAIAVHVSRGQLADAIRSSLDKVWPYLRASDRGTGHNVVIYDGDPHSEAGADVWIGVQVDRPFDDDAAPDDIRCVTVAGCEVARIVHHGPYDRLGESYSALASWCAAEGVATGRRSWEIYGDWHDDPAAVETEVYFSLA